MEADGLCVLERMTIARSGKGVGHSIWLGSNQLVIFATVVAQANSKLLSSLKVLSQPFWGIGAWNLTTSLSGLVVPRSKGRFGPQTAELQTTGPRGQTSLALPMKRAMPGFGASTPMQGTLW